MQVFGIGGEGRRHSGAWDQSGRRTADMAGIAARRGGHMGWRQTANRLGVNAGKGGRSNRRTVANVASHGAVGMAKQRAGEMCTVHHRSGCHAGAGTDVATLATQGAGRNVLGRQGDNCVVHAGAVSGRVGGAMALHAVATGGLNVGVNGRDRRQGTKVAVACAATHTGRKRNVVGRHCNRTERVRIAVALRAFARHRVQGIIDGGGRPP